MSFICPKDKWLTQKEQLKNAQLVADYFLESGWSVNAICSLLGNMKHESSINPNIFEYGYSHSMKRGFGLVQWTPAQKIYDWACNEGLDPKDGYTQLARIDYELAKGIQFYMTKKCPITFTSFIKSDLPIEYLTEAFLRNYERPANPESSLPSRISFANLCRMKLYFQPPTPSPSPVIHVVKAGDNLTRIAKKYSTTINDIVKTNNIKNPDLIYKGQKLTITWGNPK